MTAYIIRRLLLLIPTLLFLTFLVFGIARLIPADVIDLMVAEMAGASPGGATIDPEYLRHEMGLDVPVHIQYGRWLGAAVRGDLGESLWEKRPITELLIERLPVTAELGTMAVLIALLMAIPIGILSAIRQDTAADYVGRSLAILAISLPGFWLGTLVVVYPSVWWNWSPPVEYIPIGQNLGENFLQFILPATIMGMLLSGTTMRMTRTMMLEVLRQDYIKTAWAKGLREKTVIMRHALKNALIPVVSVIGITLRACHEISILFSGAGRYSRTKSVALRQA